MAARKKPTQNMFADEEQQKPTKKPTEAPQKDTEEKVKESANYLDLPSKGLLGYPSHVTYRDILVKDEEVLASASATTLTRTLNSVIKGLLNNCEWFEQMSVFDRDYVMLWLWSNNYTSKKHVDVTCGSCGHKETMEVDLTEVPVHDIKSNIPVPLEIPFGDNGEVLKVVPSTVGHEMEVEKYINKHSEEEQKGMSFERLMMIASIDLPMPFELKVKWVGENVPSRKLGYVRKYHQYFKFGVQDEVEHTCEKCGEVSTLGIPFQITDILYPELPDDFEELL